MLLAATAVACDSSPSAESDTGNPPVESDRRDVVPLFEQRSIDGVQLRLLGLRFDDDDLVVALEGINGAFGTAVLQPARASLTVDAETIESPERDALEIGPGDEFSFDLVFPVDGAVEQFSLEMPGPFGVSDDFAFDEVSVSSVDPPMLPEAVAIGLRDVQGSLGVEIDAMAFTESRIGASFVVRNGDPAEDRIIADGRRSYVEDDLGTRYLLLPPAPDEDGLLVPADGRVAGTLVFAGRVDPEATQLTGRIKTASGEVVFGPVAIDGAAERTVDGLPESSRPSVRVEHPSGVAATLDRLDFAEGETTATVTFDNPTTVDRIVQTRPALVKTSLTDDTGSAFQVVEAAADDGQLAVPAESVVEASFRFVGLPGADAATLRLAVNEGTQGAATGQRTPTPTFIWSDLPVPEPAGPGADVDASSLLVPRRTVGGADDLDRSDGAVVARTIEQFDGTDEGDEIVLTVPEPVLFDFGSAVLRENARLTIAELVGVLEFYADATVDVIGHTDAIGSTEANQRLSEARAQAVVDQLTDGGIDAGRLSAVGRGESDPVAPNTVDGRDDPDGRQRNRRVEVRIATDDGIVPTG